MSVNVFTFSGRIGRDATLRHTGKGTPVLSFPVAVDIGWGESKKTLWVDCTGFGERWEKLADYLPKGGVVTVTGEADLNTYTSNDGEKTKLVCVMRDLQLPQKGQASSQPRQQQEPPPPRRSAPPINQGFDDDEIPFS